MMEFTKLNAERLVHYRNEPSGPVDFIEEQCVARDAFDGGRSWVRPQLTPLQRQVVRDVLTTRDDSGDLLYTTMLLSWARKMAKTWLGSAMWTYRAVCWPNELILLSGPTRDAARELAFTSIVDTFTHNRALAKSVGAEVLKGTIKIRATGSEIRAVSRTLGAQAGADWSICHVDELWSFQGKQMTEFYRTLTTPSPTRKSPLLCVTSYAPIKGRSVLLEQLLARAKRHEPRLYASIVSGADAIVSACPWISKKFLRDMKRTQPPKVFKRVFLNRPVEDMGEQDRFAFSRQQVVDCLDGAWSRQEVRPTDAVGIPIVGIDFAPKHDAAAVAALARMRDRTIALLDLVVRHGNRKFPLGADWVVQTVLELVARFGPVKIFADPLGLTDQIAALRARGFQVVEVSRKGPSIADRLYRAIAGRRLRLYPDAGVVATFDGRRYGLADELHNLQLDTDTGKIGHVGEGTQPGRHYDDRCTAIGLALQAPELADLGGTVHALPVAAILGQPTEFGVANPMAPQMPIRIFARGVMPGGVPGTMFPGGMRREVDFRTGMMPGMQSGPFAPNYGFSKRYF